MSNSETARAWDNVMSFIASDEDLTTEEITHELKKNGVDTDAFLSRIGETVRKGIQAQWRKRAEKERCSLNERASISMHKVLEFPVNQLKQIIKDAERGVFGNEGRELAIACRNAQAIDISTDELRSLVADILTVTEDPKE